MLTGKSFFRPRLFKVKRKWSQVRSETIKIFCYLSGPYFEWENQTNSTGQQLDNKKLKSKMTLNSQPTDHQSTIITITPKCQL